MSKNKNWDKEMKNMVDPLADLCDPLLRYKTVTKLLHALNISAQLEADFEQIRSSPKHA